MKTKKIQKRLHQQHSRAAHERLGALILVLATLVGMASIEQDTKRYQREITSSASSAFANTSAKENELERMPVQFDSMLRWQASSSN